MTPFCTDIDLLHWEPNILRDAAFASQTLLAGTANLSGTTLTISSGSFTAANIEPNMAIVLSGTLAGTFPILSVDSATQLTISVLYDKLFPDTGSPAATPVGTATAAAYVIRTFWPQRRIVSEFLQQSAGIIPGDSRFAKASIVNPQSLQKPCVLGTLQMIYNALAAPSTAAASLSVRADLYQRLYQRALRSAQVEIDLDGDGVSDCRRQLNSSHLVRN